MRKKNCNGVKNAINPLWRFFETQRHVGKLLIEPLGVPLLCETNSIVSHWALKYQLQGITIAHLDQGTVSYSFTLVERFHLQAARHKLIQERNAVTLDFPLEECAAP